MRLIVVNSTIIRLLNTLGNSVINVMYVHFILIENDDTNLHFCQKSSTGVLVFSLVILIEATFIQLLEV